MERIRNTIDSVKNASLKKKLIIIAIILLVFILLGSLIAIIVVKTGPKSELDIAMENGLIIHNILRKQHGADKLVIDKDLNDKAQTWANYLAKSKRFEHSKTGGKYGENLAYGCGGKEVDIKNSTGDAVQRWYNEIETYNFENPSASTGVTGHFTQVVWKGSKKLGLGVATNEMNGAFCVFVVATYTPPGNYIGEYKENVLKPLN